MGHVDFNYLWLIGDHNARRHAVVAVGAAAWREASVCSCKADRHISCFSCFCICRKKKKQHRLATTQNFAYTRKEPEIRSTRLLIYWKTIFGGFVLLFLAQYFMLDHPHECWFVPQTHVQINYPPTFFSDAIQWIKQWRLLNCLGGGGVAQRSALCVRFVWSTSSHESMPECESIIHSLTATSPWLCALRYAGLLAAATIRICWCSPPLPRA